jgi:hypothetical protein
MPVPSDWSERLREFVKGLWQASKEGRLADEDLGDGPFDRFVLTESATTWDEFLVWVQELQGSWCFRGQRDARWLLNTSLDRAVKHRQNLGDTGASGYASASFPAGFNAYPEATEPGRAG